jgi:hypothetical protein
MKVECKNCTESCKQKWEVIACRHFIGKVYAVKLIQEIPPSKRNLKDAIQTVLLCLDKCTDPIRAEKYEQRLGYLINQI